MKVFLELGKNRKTQIKHPHLITITITVQKSAGLILLENLGR